jgi:hypothetical protein
MLARFTKDGFKYAKEETDPNQGVFNCSPDNVLTLTDDYGVPEPKD